MAAIQDSKPIIKATDMDQEELHKVIELVELSLKESIKEMKQEKVIARYLKTEMDKRGNGWNCVVGRNFGGHVIHQTKKYVFFQVRELSILLWKS